MVRRVHLHVGLPTSATPRLREGLHQHHETLARRGFLVSGGQSWASSVEEVAQWAGADAVVNADLLAALAPDRIQRDVAAWDDAEVHLVVTACSMTETAPRGWAQSVIDGETRGIDDFGSGVGWDPLDLAAVLQRWARVLPPERIHVVPVADTESGFDDLWRRFTEAIGVPGEPLPTPDPVPEPAWGLLQVEVLRRVNQVPGGAGSDPERDAWVSAHLSSGPELPGGGERFRPSPSTWAAWVDRGDRAVALLREGSFDVRGDLDDLQPRRDLPDWRHPDDVSEEELLRVANQLIAVILTDVRAHNRERFALEAAIAEAEKPPPPGPARRAVRRLRRWLRR